MTVRSSKQERFLALDSIRGLLAATVVIFHLPSDGYLWSLRYFQHGFLAVTFFFVLSGFVIGTTYSDRLAKGFPIGRFLGLRLGRIYPLHLFMILLLLAYEGARVYFNLGAARNEAPFTGRFALHLLPANIALVQRFAGTLSWNDPSWSIGVEWWTYVVFALLAAIVAAKLNRLATIVILAIPYFACRFGHINVGDGLSATFECMMNFALGLLICEARAAKAWVATDRLGLIGGTLVECVVVASSIWLINHFGGKLSLLVAPMFAVTIAAFSLERGLISRVLLLAPMLLIGELSYSIYMIHHFLLDRAVDLLWFFGDARGFPIHATPAGRIVIAGDRLTCDLFSMGVLATVITCSLASYSLIEKPARDWSRKMLRRTDKSDAAPRDPVAAF